MVLSWFKDEDETDKAIDSVFGGKPRCGKKYKTKDKNGKAVTRICLKERGHWFGHK